MTIYSSFRRLFVPLPHLFCLHFCLLSHFEIVRCIVKSSIAPSTYFPVFFVEMQLTKQNLKSDIWAPEFGRPKRYTGLPNGVAASLVSLQNSCCKLYLTELRFSTIAGFTHTRKKMKTMNALLGKSSNFFPGKPKNDCFCLFKQQSNETLSPCHIFVISVVVTMVNFKI